MSWTHGPLQPDLELFSTGELTGAPSADGMTVNEAEVGVRTARSNVPLGAYSKLQFISMTLNAPILPISLWPTIRGERHNVVKVSQTVEGIIRSPSNFAARRTYKSPM